MWHAFPFDGEPEVYTDALFSFGLNFSAAVDIEFGLPKKKVLSLRDVPGVTRAVVPLMSKAGVVGMTIGVNTNSAPPGVPGVKETGAEGKAGSAFRWQDKATDTEVIAVWHPGGYGGHGGQNIYAKTEAGNCVVIPGMDEALCHSWMGDNSGPPPGLGHIPLNIAQGIEVVQGHWMAYAAMFPNAVVKASNLDTFWGALAANVEKLPIFDEEVGDSWIYGIQSDPWKVAALRAMEREWSKCLPAAARGSTTTECGVTDKQFNSVGEFLLLAGKHTWGKGCEGGNLPTDWDNAAWAKVRKAENKTGDASFASCERGWTEQRMQLAAAAEAAAGTPLGQALTAEVSKLTPIAPELSGLHAVPAASWGDTFTFAGGRISLGLDTQTGTITTLTRAATTGEVSATAFAGPKNPLAEFWYKTTSQNTELDFSNNYSVTKPDPWGGLGLGVRVGLNKTSTDTRWNPTLSGLWHNAVATNNNITKVVAK